MDRQDQINQGAWIQPSAVTWLGALEGFTDQGERAAYWRIVDQARDKPILDLGVGSGRTVGLLRCLSADYVAIDYLPVMVEAARRKFPFADIRLGDARDLSQFADASFSLVVFSYMGLDAVDREARRRVLCEVRRVLKPGGMFWFSTLNLAGSAPGRRPWRSAGQGGLVRKMLGMKGALRRVPRELRNYLHGAKLRREGPGWLIAPFFAHAYGLLVHYTSLEDQLAELAHVGFRADPDVFEDVQGAQVHLGDDLSRVLAFNIIARV